MKNEINILRKNGMMYKQKLYNAYKQTEEELLKDLKYEFMKELMD
jgi:hypothetical protein